MTAEDPTPGTTTTETSAFAPADDVFDALESIAGINDDLPERLKAREQMEREHLIGLATIRQVAALTQAEVAARMGVKQTSISRLENRADVLLSTMKAYFDAVGAEATITIRIGNAVHEVLLTELATSHTTEEPLPAARKAGSNRGRSAITGRLVRESTFKKNPKFAATKIAKKST